VAHLHIQCQDPEVGEAAAVPVGRRASAVALLQSHTMLPNMQWWRKADGSCLTCELQVCCTTNNEISRPEG
jgi:hypothetical protein